MSDPLDRLRDFGQSDLGLDPPSAEQIKSRAEKIQNRRRTALVATTGTAALVMVTALSVVAYRPATQGRRLASEASRSAAPEAAAQQNAPSPTGPQDLGSAPGAAIAPETTTDRSQTGSAGVSSHARTAAISQASPVRIELEVSSGTVNIGQPVTMKLRVCNDSANEVEVRFNTSQRYDFEVTDPLTRNVVWRWSADKAFAQVTGVERFAPGCRVIGQETWNGVNQQGQLLSPGRYEIVGILTSNPPQRTQPKTICVTTCG